MPRRRSRRSGELAPARVGGGVGTASGPRGQPARADGGRSDDPRLEPRRRSRRFGRRDPGRWRATGRRSSPTPSRHWSRSPAIRSSSDRTSRAPARTSSARCAIALARTCCGRGVTVFLQGAAGDALPLESFRDDERRPRWRPRPSASGWPSRPHTPSPTPTRGPPRSTGATGARSRRSRSTAAGWRTSSSRRPCGRRDGSSRCRCWSCPPSPTSSASSRSAAPTWPRARIGARRASR